jgi:uncharacterized protein (DUF2236 family)
MADVRSREPDAIELVVGPDSITWQRAGDARVMLGIRAAILLQMAHPNVGAAIGQVMDLSGEEPWGRLVNSADFLNQLIYGGPQVVPDMARGLRKFHERIKGTTDDGRPFDALDPEAYAWVHATWGFMIVESLRHFGRALSPGEAEGFYTEWRGLGRLLGVGPGDLPDTWPGFERYVAQMVADRLEDNQTVRAFLGLFRRPPATRPPALSPLAWRLASRPAVRISRLAMIALQPSALRRRLGLQLTAVEEAQLRVFSSLSRRLTPVLPSSVLRFGPRYLEFRGRPVGSSTATPASRASTTGGRLSTSRLSGH